VVDLTQVAFVGLAGARALAAAAERAGAAGRRFGVVANSRTLARLFRITGRLSGRSAEQALSG
jgi:anti-anti-sigma factor